MLQTADLLAPELRRYVVALVAVCASTGCSIKSPLLQWEQVAVRQSAAVTPALAITSRAPVELEVPGRTVLEIDHEDLLVAVADRVSYAKLLRFSAPAIEQYEVVVEAWCHPCPPTAILWGATSLPVFVPHVMVLDDRGMEVTTIEGAARVQERLWRNMPVKGTWRLRVSAAGPYYLLITSAAAGPQFIADAGNIAHFVASPVGRIRVSIARVPDAHALP